MLLRYSNSVLCDPEPHRACCSTLRQTTQVRRGINESETGRVAQGLNQLFKPTLYLFFPGRVLKVRQSAFVNVWESFSVSEELALQCSINIRCDQSARNAKQTAEPCWDVSSLKCDNVRQWVNHSAVCCSHRGKFPSAFPFALLRASATAQSEAKRKKEFKWCLSLLAVILSQSWEGHNFCLLAFSTLMNHSLRRVT